MANVQVLLNYVPTEWSRNVDYTCQDYQLVPLSSSDRNYSSLLSKVSGSFNRSTKKIERVQNPFLYSLFLLKQQDYANRDVPVQIRELFHDTAANKVPSIVSTNLNWRLSKRVKFGKGVSFADTSEYANRYSSNQNGANRALIITDVIVGHVQSGRQNMKLPAAGYDTTSGNNHVYVKYYDNEYYPKYVVYYTSGSQQRTYRNRWHYDDYDMYDDDLASYEIY